MKKAILTAKELIDAKLPQAIKRRCDFIAFILAFVYLFSAALSFRDDMLPIAQWSYIAEVFLFASTTYLLLGTASALHPYLKKPLAFLTYITTSLLIFSPTAGSVFRVDHWLIEKLFTSIDAATVESLKKISLFEMFGDARFQPLAHLLLFARHVAFGNEVVFYNLLNIFLHSLTAFLIFSALLAFLNNMRFSFLIGLFFISLPSQFDTVVWVYHLYIIVGTIFVLAAVLLVKRYAETEKLYRFGIAVIMATLSVFMYEAAIAAPAALFFLLMGIDAYPGERKTRREYNQAFYWVVFAYLLYFAVTLYGFTLIQSGSKIAFSKNIAWNISKAGISLVKNLLETTFLKNIGIVQIERDGTVLLPYLMSFSMVMAAKIAAGIFLAAYFRLTRQNRLVVLSLAGLALSYLLTISWGRAFTNSIGYMAAQPRYQYFANAVLLVAAGLLLWQKYNEKHLKPLIISFLVVLFLWNSQTVLNGGNKIAAAMQPLDAHYYRIKEFIKTHPSSKILLDFTPEVYSQFAFGSDIAMDVLFKGSVTKSVKKAGYVYDGTSVRKNAAYEQAAANSALGDFTVSWMYYYSEETPPKREIGIAGSDKIYPCISVSPDGFIAITMINAVTGKKEIFRMKHEYSPKHTDPRVAPWASFIVEKNGNDICLIVNGIVQDKIKLSSAYADWDGDGADIVGSFYEGAKAMAMVGRFSAQTDAARYACANHAKGDTIAFNLKKPW